MAYSRLQIYDLGREIKGTKGIKIYLKTSTLPWRSVMQIISCNVRTQVMFYDREHFMSQTAKQNQNSSGTQATVST